MTRQRKRLSDLATKQAITQRQRVLRNGISNAADRLELAARKLRQLQSRKPSNDDLEAVLRPTMHILPQLILFTAATETAPTAAEEPLIAVNDDDDSVDLDATYRESLKTSTSTKCE